LAAFDLSFSAIGLRRRFIGGGKETLVVAKLATRHWPGLLTLSPRANNPSEAEPRVLGTLAASFPLRADIPQSAGVLHFTHYSNVPEVIALGGTGEVIGAVVFERAGPVPAAIPTKTVSVEGLGAVQLEVADNVSMRRLGTHGCPADRQSQLHLQGAELRTVADPFLAGD
jgi:hypothetical protein